MPNIRERCRASLLFLPILSLCACVLALTVMGSGPVRADETTFAVPGLDGLWRIKTLGQFRDVQIKQTGAAFSAYRVLWPDFEGEKYKLEHLYRGRIAGGTIKGQLFVKEEGFAGYEPLRPFQGAIQSGGIIILDGMPLARAAP